MKRFTISLDSTLATAFDRWIARRRYRNRSEAVRDLIRDELEASHQARESTGHCVAALSYVYNYRERELARRVAELQHEHHDLTVATMQVHLDHEHCLETVSLRGTSARVRRFADRLLAEPGIHHGQINTISIDLHGQHRHDDADRSDTHVHMKPVV